MKLLLPLALLASTAAAADKCDADNIVTACLASEQPKFDDCDQSDYDCLCAAQQAIATYVPPRPLFRPTTPTDTL